MLFVQKYTNPITLSKNVIETYEMCKIYYSFKFEDYSEYRRNIESFLKNISK
jgi:hypothetical protein